MAAQSIFDGWVRHSEYVAMRDGVKLAVDYYRPTKEGALHSKPLPVVWRFTPYGRYQTGADGKVSDQNAILDVSSGSNGKAIFEHLLQQGYVVAQADIRGYNASFGISEIWLGPQQGHDAFDLTEWFSAQHWGTENVGMLGRSYLGSVQLMAASYASPHLKAIVPEMAQIDHFSLFSRNGVLRNDLVVSWDKMRSAMDVAAIVPKPFSVAPVMADTSRADLLTASDEHKLNTRLADSILQMPVRDSTDPATGTKHHIESSVLFKLPQLEQSGVAIYHLSGWYDDSIRDHLILLRNLNNPQKIHIGPYFHQDNFGFDYLTETRRWFDYWLKGKDNGIMDEPRVTYYVVGQKPLEGWHHSSQWPEPDLDELVLHLSGEKSGSARSFNDGTLSYEEPQGSSDGKDVYLVDETLSLGDLITRNTGAFRRDACPVSKNIADVGEVCYLSSGYPDLSDTYDAKAITYTSAELRVDVVVAGFPEVKVFVSSNREDADLFFVLTEVTPEGVSQFVSDGAIRASHRSLNKPSFDNFGLPWHGNFSPDLTDLGPEPALISLALKPIANLFEKGNRIRLTIAGYDAKSGVPLESTEDKKIIIHMGGDYRSNLSLPIK